MGNGRIDIGACKANQKFRMFAARICLMGIYENTISISIAFGGSYKRYYNSALSIWLSVDPMADKYPSTSPYTYCGNNPIVLKDPNGREIGDYFDVNGVYLGTDGIEDGKVYVVDSKNWNQIKNSGFVLDNGETVISSAFVNSDGFSDWFKSPTEANLSDKAVFNIVSHYNSMGLPTKIGNGDFALKTTFTTNSPTDIAINTTKWRASAFLNNYYDIKSSYDHEYGHIQQFNEIGLDNMVNGQTIGQAEQFAIRFQMQQVNYQKSTSAFKKTVDDYLKKYSK